MGFTCYKDDLAVPNIEICSLKSGEFGKILYIKNSLDLYLSA